MSARSTDRRARASGSSSRNGSFARKSAYATECVRHIRSGRFLTGAHKFRFGPCARDKIGRNHQPEKKEAFFAINFNEGVARSRRSFRAPDQALESKDERIHLGERN